MFTIHTLKRCNGVAGQVSYTVGVTHSLDIAEGDDTISYTTFVGQQGMAGPVVRISHNDRQSFVTEPSRFGATFGEAWVRSFFGPEA